MKKLFLALVAAILFAGPLAAQTIPNTANLTASDAGTCATAGACLVVNINNQTAAAVIQLTGTWSATVQFEGTTSAGGTFVAINGFPLNSTTGASSATANGAWRVTASGLSQLRVRVSAFTSGTIAAAIMSSTGSASNSGGGGGGGANISGLNVGELGVAGSSTSLTSSVPIPSGFANSDCTSSCQTQLNGKVGGTATVGFEPVMVTNTTTITTSPCDHGVTTASTMTCADSAGLSVPAGVATTADGTHPSKVQLAGNTTLPSLTANTVTLLGPPSATPTAWSMQLPTAIPTTTYVLSCVITGTNCLVTPVAPNFGSVFPVTVSGTVTSGGIPCFNSTTNEQTSGALTSNVLVKGGGAGACPTNSSVTDNGTTVTSTDTGGYVAPVFTANGSTAGFFQCTQGSANGHATANTYTEECPAAVTAYEVLVPAAAATGIMALTNAAGVVTESITTAPTLTATNITGYAFPLTVTGAVSGAVPCGTATTTLTMGAILNANILTKGGGAGACPTNSSITDDAKNITTAEVVAAGNKVFLNADFTDSTSGSLVLVTGLSYTLPTSKAANYSFHCALIYDQATAAVVDQFGIGVTGTAPTQANAAGTVQITVGPPATFAANNLTALASTTPTLVVSFTPGVAATLYRAELDGTIEQPSNATPGVFSVYAFTTTGTDNLIVKRGSYCTVF